jgi:uncharacterized protein YceH (UPF0502 family)
MDAPSEDKLTAFFPLDSRERRVLGVLIEKGLTTPEYYPLTLKALTTGCNQKNNRDPVVSYDEESVEDVIAALRAKGLVAAVHTETGRTERFRHYVRHKFAITEPQIAVLAELLLRGRQQLGELRTRASRMVPIDSLEELREAVEGLIAMGGAQANGDLARRGIEIDHAFYTDGERNRNPNLVLANSPASVDDDVEESPAPRATVSRSAPAAVATSADTSGIERQLAELRQENRALRDELTAIKDDFRSLRDEFDNLRRDLGG